MRWKCGAVSACSRAPCKCRGAMLLTEPEQRASTTTGAYDGPSKCSGRSCNGCSGAGIFDACSACGSIPFRKGHSEWPLITAGVAPVQTAEDADAPPAVAYTIAPTTSLKPKRLTGRYEFTAEAAASVIDLEGALAP